VFWTEALWDTNRSANLASVANQSLRGTAGRWSPEHTSTAYWLVLVVATLAFWVWRVERCRRNGDELGGLALTGIVGCLISPVTWVGTPPGVAACPRYCCWWTAASPRAVWRRRHCCSWPPGCTPCCPAGLVWYYGPGTRWDLVLGGNAYVLASLALLILLPTAGPGTGSAGSGAGSAGPGVAQLGQVGDATDPKVTRSTRPAPSATKSAALVEPDSPRSLPASTHSLTTLRPCPASASRRRSASPARRPARHASGRT